jgi:hypothetical protein
MLRHPATADAYLTLVAAQETVPGPGGTGIAPDVLVRIVCESSSLRVGLDERRACLHDDALCLRAHLDREVQRDHILHVQLHVRVGANLSPKKN